MKHKILKPPFLRELDLAFLQRSVVVMCGPLSSLEEVWKTQTKYPEKWKDIHDKILENYHGYPEFRGCCFECNGDVFIIIRDEWNSAIYIHECYHAVQKVMNLCNSKCEEISAYLLEYLFQELVWPNDRGYVKCQKVNQNN